MRRNSELVFDPGNQFGALSSVPPYFGLPGWWRRFLFRLLLPRDLAVYVYLCSLMDSNDICYPTTKQIREEVGVDSPTTIFSALGKLEELGFILRRKRRLPGRLYKFQRNIYQRPAPEFTLHKLIDLKKIDGRLRPISPATGKPLAAELAERSDRAVEMGLRNLLGERYLGYEEAQEEGKVAALVVLLQERLAARISEFGPKAQAAMDESRANTGVTIRGKKYRAREVVGEIEEPNVGAEESEGSFEDDEAPF